MDFNLMKHGSWNVDPAIFYQALNWNRAEILLQLFVSGLHGLLTTHVYLAPTSITAGLRSQL